MMMKFKKTYEYNRHWNDCEFQLHWDKLEWVNPRSKIKTKNPIQLLQNNIFIDQDDRTYHWVGHSLLK